MSPQELRAIIDEVFVQILVERVIEKIAERLLEANKEALVVFTGANIGAPLMLESMERLRKEGLKFHVLLSAGAAKLYDIEKIRQTLEPVDLWIENPAETPEALTKKYDNIIVPTLSVRSASHVAMCMADTPAQAVILDGLMRGKNVVINLDGCCPDNKERVTRGFNMAEPLKQVLRNHLESIKSYGAKLTSSKGLYRRVMNSLQLPVASAPSAQVTAAPSASVPVVREKKTAGIRIPMNGKIFSVRYLKTVSDGSTVIVPADAMITQASADEARARGIKIVKEA